MSSKFTSIGILIQYVITMLFYEVTIKSQILSNNFIRKNPRGFAI